MVRIQAVTICPTIPQRTADNRLDEPTPRIAAEMTWVVLIGAPKNDATAITPADDVSAENPCTASRLKILWPIVLIIFQPPVAVPMAMHRAQASWTQRHSHIGDLMPDE